MIRKLIVVGMLLLMIAVDVSAQQRNGFSDAPPLRRIFVPFENLEVLLDGNSNRVLLTNEEYQTLLNSARVREIETAPVKSAILSANYRAEVRDEVAHITGELLVESLDSGLTQIPLTISGVAIRAAQLGKQPAKLWRNPQGQLMLLCSESKRETLRLEFTVQLQTSAARQTMALQLPAPPATKFTLNVPGNVEIKSGAAMVARKYEKKSDATTFEILPTDEPMSIVMSLNNRRLREDQIIVARNVVFHKLTSHSQELHVTSSLDVIHGAVEEIKFAVPEGFEIASVNTELLRSWEIDTDENNKRDILKIQLRQPTREPVVLSLSAIRARSIDSVAKSGTWTAAELRPLNLAGDVSVIGVLADIGLTTKNLKTKGLIPIDHAFLAAAIPTTMSVQSFDRPVVMVTAGYAPQPDYTIDLDLAVAKRELEIKSNSRLQISDQELQLTGGLALVCLHDSLFAAEMSLPAGWRLNEVTDIAGNPLRFDRLESVIPNDPNSRQRWLVRFQQAVSSNRPTRVFFSAAHTPDGWLEKWQTRKITFPDVLVAEQTQHSGVLTVATEEDMQLNPTIATGLEVLDDSKLEQFNFRRDEAPLAYQFNDSKFELAMELTRLQPVVSARVYHLFAIQPTELSVHAELFFDIKRARETKFQFRLPLDSPKSLKITAANQQLKDYRSEEDETGRLWTVELADPVSGEVHLLVDFQSPLAEGQRNELILKPIDVQAVQFQSSLIAVEGSSELDLNIATEARPIDVGEFAVTRYQPGRRTLGTFTAPHDQLALAVTSERRPVFELPAAIVQRAEMVTTISNQGIAQTAARFLLAAKQQPFLRMELPIDAKLWSVLVDGEPAKPQRAGDTLLISLAGTETNQLRDLQLVYEAPFKPFRLFGSMTAVAPRLWLTSNAKDVRIVVDQQPDDWGTPVPLVDLKWRMMLPDGFSISRGDANFQSDELNRAVTPLFHLSHWFVELGGGFRDLDDATAAKSQFDSSQMSAPTNSLDSIQRFGSNSDKSKQIVDEDVKSNRGPRDESVGKDIGGSKKESSAKPQFQSDAALDWALSGLRSLDIELTDTGNAITFFNLGEQSTLNVTIVNQSRLNWFAIAVAMLVAAVGVLLTNRKLATKTAFLLLLFIATAGVLPLMGGAMNGLRTMIDLVLLVGVLLVIYFVMMAIAQTLFRLLARLFVSIPVRLFLLGALISNSIVSSSVFAQEVVTDAHELKRLIAEIQSDKPVRLPADAIIVPYDLDNPDGPQIATKLLLPYDEFLRLTGAAALNADSEKLPIGPVAALISAAEYEIKLSSSDDLAIVGRLAIDVLTDDPVLVELPMHGGALSDATVDGQLAKLRVDAMEASKKKQKSETFATRLYLTGRGTKQFEFTVRVKPQRAGGWRLVECRLPVGETRGLNLQTMNEATEVRLTLDKEVRSIEAKPNQAIATVLNADGSLRLQWKPSTAAQAVDQSLTANSAAILDVREDGLRLNWLTRLDFRGSERDTFSLELPADFMVERIDGDNVRAWEVTDNMLNVTLLAPAKDRESFLIELSQRGFSITEKETKFSAPYLKVVGAALHQGEYRIRRSPIIELKTGTLSAASRIDQSSNLQRIDMAKIDEQASPLGIEPFQSLKFLTTPFEIELQASVIPRQLTAATQTVLRIGQTEANLESRLNYSAGERPIYELSFEIPNNAIIRRLTAGRIETWTTTANVETQTITMRFPAGVTGDFSVIVEFDLKINNDVGEDDKEQVTRWSVPKIKLNDVEKQAGQIAVQLDPAISVSVTELANCETVLLQTLESWLTPQQRAITRLALQTKGAEYAATLNFSEIAPRVTVETVTNVRTTFFAIEETMLLDFQIQDAGIREIKFELPSEMSDANIAAKLVSERLIQPVPDDLSLVLVTLKLQDDVIDDYRVVIEHDRQLSSLPQSVPIPRVLTGTTEGRFVTLQNAGRDEVNVLPSTGFERLNRQMQKFSQLKKKLGDGELTLAYVADAEAVSPALQFETQARAAFDTVTASIEFSKTTMVVDAGGAYRALQNFQINNRAEQYLDIELPEDATLLTVVVAGQPIKPVAWPAAKNARRLRVPLVKTPPGDLDYSVQLKYAGTLGELSNFQTIHFPVIETLNINVQLSQLHLRLPESHQWWSFDGTMTKVDDRGELEEGYLSYKANQIQQLAEQLRESSSLGSISNFSKSRAIQNLKILESEMLNYQNNAGRRRGQSEGKLEEMIQGNADAIEQAEQSYNVDSMRNKSGELDNRQQFNKLVESQSGKFARNSITRGRKNFESLESEQGQSSSAQSSQQQSAQTDRSFGDDPFGDDEGINDRLPRSVKPTEHSLKSLERAIDQADQSGSFDRNWFARNQLETGPLVQLPANTPNRLANENADSDLRGGMGFDDGKIASSQSGEGMAGGGMGMAGGQMGAGMGMSNGEGLRTEGAIAHGLGGANNTGGDLQSGLEQAADANVVVRDRVFSPPVMPAEPQFDVPPGSILTPGTQGGEEKKTSEESPAATTLDTTNLENEARKFSEQGRFSAAAMTSLEIELPSRGVDFYFKSPRGNATVTARPVATGSYHDWLTFIATITIGLIVCLSVWLIQRVGRSKLLTVLSAVGLVLIGLISVGTFSLPLYGLLGIAGGIVLLLRNCPETTS